MVWEFVWGDSALVIEALCSNKEAKKLKTLACAANGDPSKAKEAPHERSVKNKYFFTFPEKNALTTEEEPELLDFISLFRAFRRHSLGKDDSFLSLR
ncbi:hypothetical protein A2943_01200 [Candidatus Adlerbacteria bacterium RIFCSPLOWO2_01_FULL_51_16]|uniref:Uncharacterized protein n=1 Tax=Candidatus Adlerbacteria bacterium RIFCSPLOWO2_01_FULL_51_16 TaxID=1797243 RepID=A0A1F4XFA0_9BACT|nr:MAG: hypothetical protein A2943_01200 [Candidatus Adlerbacteria bacterium RIFCSPLOWO2_01_FULL_51_16]